MRARSLILLLTACLLSACGPSQKDKQDVVVRQLGDFHVTQFLVLPGPDIQSQHMRSNPEALADFTQRMRPFAIRDLSQHSTGRAVDMTITINMIHLETSTGMAMLAGDAKAIDSTITLQDSETHEQLLSVPLYVKGANIAGLGGLLYEANNEGSQDQERDTFSLLYVSKLIDTLYPRAHLG